MGRIRARSRDDRQQIAAINKGHCRQPLEKSTVIQSIAIVAVSALLA
jgi:hypothetical protein